MEDNDDDVIDLDLEALQGEALAEATSRSELARAALSQESTPELPRKKVQTTLVMAAR